MSFRAIQLEQNADKATVATVRGVQGQPEEVARAQRDHDRAVVTDVGEPAATEEVSRLPALELVGQGDHRRLRA